MKERRIFLWTHEMAYIVGLITTDGCLSSSGRHITFTSKDLDLIETFSNILKLKNKIGLTKNPRSVAYRIQFGDVQFYRWLLSIGLMPDKSKVLGSINVPDRYFTDFLRGHLDGDGSIIRYIDTYNAHRDVSYVYERLSVKLISASEKHVIWLKGKISDVLEVEGRLHKTKPNPKTGNSMYLAKFGKKASLGLLRKIYYEDGLPSLDRKRELAYRFIRQSNKKPALACGPTKQDIFRVTARDRSLQRSSRREP